MPKLIVSIDGVVIREAELTKERTTLGRRPYNDIVIDNLAVSGEHALLLVRGSTVVIEDLHSTNGTYVNGHAIRQQQLRDGDVIDIAKYKVKFLADPVAAESHAGVASGSPAAALGDAMIKVLSGASAGRELALTKAVNTLGKAAVAVIAITKQPHHYAVHQVEGGGNPCLNGAPIGHDPLPLKNGDVIELAGTRMQFVQT